MSYMYKVKIFYILFSFLLCSVVNVGIGIALFEAGGCSVLSAGDYTILWVYIGFVIFLLTLQVVLFIVFSVLAIAAGPESKYIALSSTCTSIHTVVVTVLMYINSLCQCFKYW